jgi:transposase
MLNVPVPHESRGPSQGCAPPSHDDAGENQARHRGREPANLLRHHPLARSLADAAFGEFLRQREYKTEGYGSTLVKANPFYPSTKRGSGSGNVKGEMPLSERVYQCEVCGQEMDRDLNASRNLAMLAASSAERINAGGERRFMPGTAGAAQGIRNPPSSVLVTNV